MVLVCDESAESRLHYTQLADEFFGLCIPGSGGVLWNGARADHERLLVGEWRTSVEVSAHQHTCDDV